jgi:hypothetical protein
VINLLRVLAFALAIILRIIQGIFFVFSVPLAIISGLLKLSAIGGGLTITIIFFHSLIEHTPLDWSFFIGMSIFTVIIAALAFLPEKMYEFVKFASEKLWEFSVG